MEQLKTEIKSLPTTIVSGISYLSYQAVTSRVATYLFPSISAEKIGAADYQHLLKMADSLCRELGYVQVVKLTPPEVPLNQMGLYWTKEQPDCNDTDVIIAGPGRVEMMQNGLLLDARLSQLGLDEVTRQHFKIPVTASDSVIDLMHRAVASDWPNDYKGIWHDVLGMCIAGGKDISTHERLFAVIIRGLGQRRYWRFKAHLQQDDHGSPFLYIGLAEEHDSTALFDLGQVVMTPGAAALGIHFTDYIARHASGDDGELDGHDKQQNQRAIKEGLRVLSAYNVPIGGGETERIWIITEADRSCTTILLPAEY